MNSGLFIGLILLGAALLVFWLAIERILKTEREKSRSPFGEKMLRPAGESLRLKVDEIRESILNSGLWLAMALVAPSMVIMFTRDITVLSNLILWLVSVAAGYGWAYVQWKKIRNFREKLRRYQLGFDGERWVAAELNAVVALGHKVFHDFVVDWYPGGETSNFNIDHIVVGPRGIFVIETKARRKPNGEIRKEGRSHEITFTGEALILPSGYEDTKTIRQAQRNAQELFKWLKATEADLKQVVSLVVIPGWNIIRRGKGSVSVVSGNELAKHLPGMGEKGALTEDEVRKISARIEAHCRNVELT